MLQLGVGIPHGLYAGYKYNVTDRLAPRIALGTLSETWFIASTGLDYHLRNEAEYSTALSLMFSYVYCNTEGLGSNLLTQQPGKGEYLLLAPHITWESLIISWLSARFSIGGGYSSEIGSNDFNGPFIILELGLNVHLNR